MGSQFLSLEKILNVSPNFPDCNGNFEMGGLFEWCFDSKVPRKSTFNLGWIIDLLHMRSQPLFHIEKLEKSLI